VLETERLTLRTWSLDDFEAHAAMSMEPEVCRYLTGGQPPSRFGAWQSFAAHVGHWQLRGFGHFAVIERATGGFVGRVGPWHPEGWLDFEIGWTLRTAYWGRGYATEAAKRCIEYAFTELKRPHLISLIHPENVRSIRVAERIGQRLDGSVPLPHMPDLTVLVYRLTMEQWRSAGRQV
jgi:RimJ/RimL family protein N-acetyltransferase